MAHALSLPLAIPVCVAIVSCVAAAHAEDDVLWPQKPVRIDRSKQHYERLPALQESIDRRTWLVVPSRITINDSAAFTFDGTTYRIGNIHPISTKRMCTNPDGTKWTCGRMAAILLNNLVRGKRLLCNRTEAGKVTVLSDCQSGTKRVAAEIIERGLGRTDAEGLKYVDSFCHV